MIRTEIIEATRELNDEIIRLAQDGRYTQAADMVAASGPISSDLACHPYRASHDWEEYGHDGHRCVACGLALD